MSCSRHHDAAAASHTSRLLPVLQSQLTQGLVALPYQLRDTALTGRLQRQCSSQLLPLPLQLPWLQTAQADTADVLDLCLQFWQAHC